MSNISSRSHVKKIFHFTFEFKQQHLIILKLPNIYLEMQTTKVNYKIVSIYCELLNQLEYKVIKHFKCEYFTLDSDNK